MLLKICGITRVEDVEVVEGRADYSGFIVGRAGGPRVLSLGEARDLASTASRTKPVMVAAGLTPGEAVEAASKAGVFRVVQYHSPLTPPEASSLGEALRGIGVGLAVVVTVVAGSPLPARPGEYSTLGYEYLLVDSPKPAMVRYDMGLGVHPRILESLVKEAPRIGVAGGVTPGNAHLVVALGPHLVDVSSGVEREPGVKDEALVEALSSIVRGSKAPGYLPGETRVPHKPGAH